MFQIWKCEKNLTAQNQINMPDGVELELYSIRSECGGNQQRMRWKLPANNATNVVGTTSEQHNECGGNYQQITQRMWWEKLANMIEITTRIT